MCRNFGRFIRCTPTVYVNPLERKYAAMELGHISMSETTQKAAKVYKKPAHNAKQHLTTN